MILFTVTCRMLTKRNKTVTNTTKVKARDGDEARAKARQVFWQRGYQGVETLVAFPA
ncbi:MAG: hypothetical protein M0R77_19930 [Gammaproteobacteria bacterium]|nr:hypothetical protein [Gammaproteobacteria bacterium]